MSARQKEISVIGISYVDSIFEIAKKLKALNVTHTSPIRASSIENGYSCSLIALSVFMVESALNRVRYLEKAKDENNLRFFQSKFSNPVLYEKLQEIYVLRDLIVHNHIWLITYDIVGYQEKNVRRRLLKGYGSKMLKPNFNYRICVNMRKKITKKMKLNIVPTKINRDDAFTVLKFVKELFEFLKSKNHAYFPLNAHFKYNGQYLTFYEIVDSITT